MRIRHQVGSLAAAATLLACSAPEKSPASYLPERDSPAFAAAASLHASEVAQLPTSPAGGLWVVEDSLGNLVASGVLTTFPASISSENFGAIVPGAAGRQHPGQWRQSSRN